MPEKFDELSDEQLQQASLPVDKEDVSSHVVVHAKPKKTALWIKLLLVLLLLVCLSLFAWVYFLQQSLGVNQNSLLVAQSQIEHLQQRLSVTDEHMSDSKVAIQLHIKDLSEKTDQLWQQMDKLWASAWRRNQKEIGSMTQSIETLLREQKGLQKNVTQQGRRLANLQKGLSSDIEKLQKQLKKMHSKQSKQEDQLQLLQQQTSDADKSIKQLHKILKRADVERLQLGLAQLQQQLQQLNYSVRKLQSQVQVKPVPVAPQVTVPPAQP